MKTIHKGRTCGPSMPMEVGLNDLRVSRRNEYEALLPRAKEILEQKKQELMQCISNLGCYVYIGADARGDTGYDAWLTLSITLEGEFGNHVYSSSVYI